LVFFCVCLMVFNATFNNISAIYWWSVLLVEENGIIGGNHRPASSNWQTLSHDVVSSISLVENPSSKVQECKKVMHATTMLYFNNIIFKGRRGRDRMVVGFITTNAISAYHN
jgi:hypothetical protein